MTERVLWDRVVLQLAVGPLVLVIFWFLSFLTAPAAIFLAIKHWRTPGSLVRKGRVRMVIGLCAAVLVVLGWIGGFLAIWVVQTNG